MHYCSNLDENNKEQGTYIMHVDFLLLVAAGCWTTNGQWWIESFAQQFR
jgi:hypothetical protein